ncbi:MAG: DMT family transporter [Pseudomonadota bacterium]
MNTVPTPAAHPLALIGLLAGACAIAFAPILVRFSEVGPVATAFWRILLALPAAFLWLLAERRRAAAPLRWRPLVLCGLFFAGDLALWHTSIVLTTVANATLLVNMAPIFVTLGAWLVFRTLVTRTFLAGMALSVGGAALLAAASTRFSSQHLAGDALALLAAVSYAGYILAIKELRGTLGTGTILALSGVFTCLALLPASLALGEPLVPSTSRGWAIVILLALVCQLGGQSLITWAMRHLPAPFSAVSLLLQPVVAALLAWALLAEAVGPLQAIGAAAVLLGIYAARRGSL